MDDDTVKKLREKRKRETRKRVVIGIITIVVIAIIISAYAFYQSTLDTYWKPSKAMNMPQVNWNSINSSCIVKRTTYDQDGTQAPNIHKIIGREVKDKNFRVGIIVELKRYIYDANTGDELISVPTLYAEKIGGNYVVKELVFHYEFGDHFIDAPYPTTDDFKAKNIYFLIRKETFIVLHQS